MPKTEAIDYAALANKFGATSAPPAEVDYEALAKQFGGDNAATLADQAAKYPTAAELGGQPGAPTEGAKPLSSAFTWEGLKTAAKTAANDLVVRPATMVKDALLQPGPLVQGIVDASVKNGKTAMEAYRQGHMLDAASNGLAAIPVAGPMIQGMAQDAGRDPAMGVGHLASTIAAPALAKYGGAAVERIAPDVLVGDVPRLQAEKLGRGLERQNTALKTVQKSFNDNTIVRGKESITPIDTLKNAGIVPEVEHGTIKMGDYRTGVGPLGKLKTMVGAIDDQIDTTLKDTGKTVSLDELKQQAIDRAKANPDLRQGGLVKSTITKIESRFDDYKESYGDSVDISELNSIRKVANRDWSPETQDVSRIVGDVARDHVHNATDDMAVKGLLQKQGELLAAKKYAETLEGKKVVGGKLTQKLMGIGGGIIGSTIEGHGLIGSIAGEIGGEQIAKALQQTQFKSPIVEARSSLQQLEQYLNRPIKTR